MPSKVAVPLEDAEQRVVVNYLRLRERQFSGRMRFHHSPNGETRQKRVNRSGKTWCPSGQRLAEMGTSPGFPDLVVFVAGEMPIAVEMKRANGRPSNVTAEQSGWLSFLTNCGWRTRVCFGANEAIRFLRECGV